MPQSWALRPRTHGTVSANETLMNPGLFLCATPLAGALALHQMQGVFCAIAVHKMRQRTDMVLPARFSPKTPRFGEPCAALGLAAPGAGL